MRPGDTQPGGPACQAPFVALEFDPAGIVYACCASQLYPVGRVGESTLDQIWNGSRARVLRDAMDDWDFTVACSSCRWHLEHGRPDPDAAVYDRYTVDTGDVPLPRAMTFALSNRCNLACEMCSPALSSTLRARAGLAPLRSPYDDEFFDQLEPMLHGLEYAKFLGGEPLLVPEHARVWDLLAKQPDRPQVQITTNGTIWNDRVEWLFETFELDVTISIDGVTKATYESIRRGASHERVMRNVERYRDASSRQDTELRFCFCLMPQNADELAPFLLWADELGAAVSINLVTDLGFSLHDQPRHELVALRDRWRGCDASLWSVAPAIRQTWETQLVQLDAVLASATPPSPRQAQPASGGLVRPHVRDGVLTAQSSHERRRRLVRWASGGDVAELHFDEAGALAKFVSEHRRLGLTREALRSATLENFVDVLARTTGRSLWALDSDQSGSEAITVFVLSDHPPARGESGRVIRTVLHRGESLVLLVAEDDFYEQEPVAVSISTISGGHEGQPR